MLLAATLLQDGARPVSTLPTIKCSTCGNEIEIAAMADHICGGSSGPSETEYKSQMRTLSNPFVLKRPDDSSGRVVPAAQTRPRAPTLSKKLPRVPLPRINAEAANRSYLAPTTSGLDTPATSTRSAGSSGKNEFQRSMTSPMPRLFDPRPPSPELSANLDCAFPPFPDTAATGRRPSTPQGRTTLLGSDRAPSRSASRMDQMVKLESDSSSLEPKSPRKNGGQSVLRKLDTLKSGPFAAKSRQDSAESRDSPSHEGTSLPSVPTIAIARYEETSQANACTGAQPSPSPYHDSLADEKGPQTKVAPPRPARPSSGDVLSPSFLDQFSSEPIDLNVLRTSTIDDPLASWSNALPISTDGPNPDAPLPSLSRMRSEPAMNSSSGQRPTMTNGTESSLRHPARSSSRSSIRVDCRMQDAPPVPRPVLQHRQQASKHAPSESGSSAASTAYSSSTDSMRPSPAASSASSLETFSPLASAAHKFSDEQQMWPAGLNVRNQQKPGMRAEQPLSSSPRSLARPAVPTSTQSRLENDFSSQQLESPMYSHTRAINTTASPSRPSTAIARDQPQSTPWTAAQEHSPLPQSVSRSAAAVSPYEILNSSDLTNLQSNSPPPSTPQGSVLPEQKQDGQARTSPKRRAATSQRPVCRGCKQAIEGKSVKAADGRLTGRWHKACFVCRSCQSPFTTADFYVIDNEPYCEHHYHQQNGSLCHGCNRGIEGQYLETTSTSRPGEVEKLYHPTCFTCCQCRSVLTDSYFEITGRVFCERHALAVMRAQARMGGRNGAALYPNDRRNMFAERRTTRLINPMVA